MKPWENNTVIFFSVQRSLIFLILVSVIQSLLPLTLYVMLISSHQSNFSSPRPCHKNPFENNKSLTQMIIFMLKAFDSETTQIFVKLETIFTNQLFFYVLLWAGNKDLIMGGNYDGL